MEILLCNRVLNSNTFSCLAVRSRFVFVPNYNASQGRLEVWTDICFTLTYLPCCDFTPLLPPFKVRVYSEDLNHAHAKGESNHKGAQARPESGSAKRSLSTMDVFMNKEDIKHLPYRQGCGMFRAICIW